MNKSSYETSVTYKNAEGMFKSYPDVMCVKEVMSALKISRHRVYELITRGELSSFRIGNTHRITKNALLKYISNAC